MSDLSDLQPQIGSKRVRSRKGRGPASHLGKTSGRGQKGAGARKSSGISPAFEGGQMPLQKRVPKRGFRSHFPNHTQIVNLGMIEKRITVSEIDREVLYKSGLVRNIKDPIKVLANGTLTKKIIIKVDSYSESAKKAIEAIGGQIKVGE